MSADRIRSAGIIAIVRGEFGSAALMAIAETLARSGIGALEVTLNSTGALAAIERLQEELGQELLIGAGTVRTRPDAERAVAAGAAFLVSPNLDLATVAYAHDAGVTHLPGVFTATEAHAAFAAGCRLVKLFPADALGPAYLRALRAPLDDVDFVPTGGIDAGNVEAYVRAGAVAVGVGSSLVSGPGQDLGALAERADRLLRAIQRARGGPSEAVE